MRSSFALPCVLIFTLLVPAASAEFGFYDASGWPVAIDGRSTDPSGILPAGIVPEGPLNAVGPLTLYPYYPVLTGEVQRLAREHPDIVKLHSIGKSTAGLDLWMLEIADFENADMLPLAAREVVWVDGGTHSNEYSGVWFAAHLASFLADGYGANETATWIVENRHTWIMPLVNPDGSNAFGRLNANAVNINRNYPVAWGDLNEDPLFNNPGPAPASEVETQHNVAWWNRTRPDLYVSVHCCGNLWLYPYGIEGLDPLDQQALSRVCDEAFASVREFCGPIWSTIYPASGSSVDTIYEYTGAVAFGYEMSGRGAVALWGQPFTATDVEVEERESWEGLMHGLLNVHLYGAYPTIVGANIVGGDLVVRVRNDGYGNLSTAMVRHAEATLVLPPLSPGEETTAVLAGPWSAGTAPLVLEYIQRHMAAPVATREIPVTLVNGPRGLEVTGLDGDVMPLATASADVPAPGIAALVVLALLALARRRAHS